MKTPDERTREPPPDSVLRWEVQRFLRPFQDRLEVGTREMAMLHAIRALDRDDRYRARVYTLQHSLAETQDQFDADMARELSPDAARHSMVRDIKRAFQRLQEQLEDLPR